MTETRKSCRDASLVCSTDVLPRLPVEPAGFPPAPGPPAVKAGLRSRAGAHTSPSHPGRLGGFIPAAGNGQELGAAGTSGSWKLPSLAGSHPRLQQETISELCGFN